MGEHDQVAAVEPADKTVELTLTIEGRYEAHRLEKDFSPDHAYGPVERVLIRRDMYSSIRNYNIVDVNTKVVEGLDGSTDS